MLSGRALLERLLTMTIYVSVNEKSMLRAEDQVYEVVRRDVEDRDREMGLGGGGRVGSGFRKRGLVLP